VRSDAPVTHVRLDVFPDGGLARLRVHGEIPPATLAETTVRWLDRLPEQQAREVLAEAGLSADEAGKLLAARPFTTADAVPAEVVTALLGG
jgi:allantoicase